MAGLTAGIVRASASTANNSPPRSAARRGRLPWRFSWQAAALALLW